MCDALQTDVYIEQCGYVVICVWLCGYICVVMWLYVVVLYINVVHCQITKEYSLLPWMGGWLAGQTVHACASAFI